MQQALQYRFKETWCRVLHRKCLRFGESFANSKAALEANGQEIPTVDLKGPRIGWARLASTSQPNISAGNMAAIARL